MHVVAQAKFNASEVLVPLIVGIIGVGCFAQFRGLTPARLPG